MVEAELRYETLKFQDAGTKIRAILLNHFYFDFDRSELGFDVSVKDGALYADITLARLENRFNKILSIGFTRLTNALNNKHTVYIHKNSGIPLIGHNAFGIVDRNTSLIEIKPITGCNLNCVFCSVDEGISSKKVSDFVIEKDYLIEELKKLVQFKGMDDIEINIGTNGEPFLYGDMLPLINDIKEIPSVKIISVNTNGTLLTKSMIDELIKAGLTQINLSLNAVTKESAERLAGTNYNLAHVMEMAEYAAKRLDLIIAPLWVPGINDEDMPKLIEFGKRINAKYVAIQNFLNYQHGRNPAEQKPWDKFYQELKKLESEYKIKLIFNANDFNIRDSKKLPVPFKKGEKLKLKLQCHGRLKNECLAIDRDRIISVISNKPIGDSVRCEIIRTKHNIVVAKEI